MEPGVPAGRRGWRSHSSEGAGGRGSGAETMMEAAGAENVTEAAGEQAQWRCNSKRKNGDDVATRPSAVEGAVWRKP